MKRLTDTEKWDKFLFELPIEYKLLWLFITDKCSNAGIWNANLKIAEAYIGAEINKDRALELFAERIHVFDNGKKWWIVTFPAFQEKNKLNSNHNRQSGIINELEKYGLLKLILKTSRKEKNNAIVYEITDHVLPINQQQNTYLHTYADSYDNTLSVSVTEEVTVKESENKNHKFNLLDPRKEILEKFGYFHPELKSIPAGEPVEDIIWLAGKVIHKNRGQPINNQPFDNALKLAFENLNSESWFVNSGGLYWLLDVKNNNFNGKECRIRIAKYMNKIKPRPEQRGPKLPKL